MPIVEVSFRVDGHPAGKGSMRAIPVLVNGKYQYYDDGRQKMRMVPQSKKTSQHTKTIADAALAEMMSLGIHGHLMTKGVEVDAKFFFRRPDIHYRTGKNAHLLKSKAPEHHTTTPDIDKLQRLIGDALTGVVYEDDKQIWKWRDPTKTWISGDSYTLVKVIGYIPEVDLF